MEVEEVINYRYLGGVLNRFLRDFSLWKEIFLKMKSAMNRTMFLGVGHFSLKTVSILFNSLIASTGIYGSQLFIPSKSTGIKFDRIMRSFFKKAFRGAISSHSAVFYGELRELDFIHRFSISCLQYLWRLVHSNQSNLVFKLFNLLTLEVGYRGRVSYCEFIFGKLNYYDCCLEKLKVLSKESWSKYVHAVAVVDWKKLVASSKLLSYDYAQEGKIPFDFNQFWNSFVGTNDDIDL